MWPLLRQQIGIHVSLTPEEYERVESFFSYKKFRKKQYILQEGDVCRHETFILKGCARMYHVGEDGQEHVTLFGIEGWWVGDLHSSVNDKPSIINIDCLEECEVLQITMQSLDKLYAEVPAMERFFRLLLQNAYISFQHRILVMLTRPAAERYKDFLERYPKIEERIPDHQVASYLGITPQSLSRIRSQFTLKKY
jgi:CRP-like cAMP-binding protein